MEKSFFPNIYIRGKLFYYIWNGPGSESIKMKRGRMITKDQLCDTIRTVYPDLGICGNDITTAYDAKNKAWTVRLKKGNRWLKTFVETEDARLCIEGKQCLGLGVQVHQLRDNLSQIS